MPYTQLPEIHPEIQIGYEFEMGSPLNRPAFKDEFAKEFGVTWEQPWPNWDVKDDCTLGSFTGNTGMWGHGPGIWGHELVTPPLGLHETFDILRRVFDWMKATGAQTNGTCGLHVGMSIKGINLQTDLDPLKLVLLSDDEAIQEKFDRTYRGDSHLGWIKSHIMWPKDLKSARSALQKTGRTSINLVNAYHNRRNYIEFRAMGNTNYHLKYDIVEASILNYAASLTSAIQRGADLNVYVRELKSKLGIEVTEQDLIA